MTAVACQPLAWRLSNIRRADDLDPREEAVEEILQLRHDVDDHQLAVTLLQGIRPDLTSGQLDDAIDELIDKARWIRDAESWAGGFDAVLDDYETTLRTFVQGGPR